MGRDKNKNRGKLVKLLKRYVSKMFKILGLKKIGGSSIQFFNYISQISILIVYKFCNSDHHL